MRLMSGWIKTPKVEDDDRLSIAGVDHFVSGRCEVRYRPRKLLDGYDWTSRGDVSCRLAIVMSDACDLKRERVGMWVRDRRRR